MQVGREAIITLAQGSMRDTEGVQALEEAAAELYRALQAGRDGGEFRACLRAAQAMGTNA